MKKWVKCIISLLIVFSSFISWTPMRAFADEKAVAQSNNSTISWLATKQEMEKWLPDDHDWPERLCTIIGASIVLSIVLGISFHERKLKEAEKEEVDDKKE